MLYPSTIWDTTMKKKRNLPRRPKYKANSMSVKKSDSKLVNKLIALLLTLQIILLGIQAKNRIQQGDSTIEVLISMVENTITLLKKIKSEKQ